MGIYLTYVWRWNTMNDMGVQYNVRMLEQKDIRLDFGNGPTALEVSPTLPVAKICSRCSDPTNLERATWMCSSQSFNPDLVNRSSIVTMSWITSEATTEGTRTCKLPLKILSRITMTTGRTNSSTFFT